MPKGQLISKSLFGIFNSPKKWMKKNLPYCYSTSSRIVFVRFLGELKTSERHFEINWPLNRDLLLDNSLLGQRSLFFDLYNVQKRRWWHIAQWLPWKKIQGLQTLYLIEICLHNARLISKNIHWNDIGT